MSDINQVISFAGSGLNTDDSNITMPVGDSPYRLNVFISEDGLNGVITNMKGNEKKEYALGLSLSNVYFTLGSYYNELTRKAYYFIFSQPYDSGGGVYLYDNKLLVYNEDAQTIETVFNDPHNYMGLDPYNHIVRPRMIDDWLFYNPVANQPMMIDVVRAYNYTNYDKWSITGDYNYSDIVTFYGGLFVADGYPAVGDSPSDDTSTWRRIGDCYQDETTLSQDELRRCFLLLKTPPVDRVIASYASNTSVNYNKVRGKTFRFCHRYQYFDNSYSTCSAYSDWTFPDLDESYNGEINDDITLYNYIELTFSLYSAALIKNIELFFQEPDDDWKLLAIVKRWDQSLLDTVNYTFNFYNDGAYQVQPLSIFSKVADAVPKNVGALDVVNENVLCLAKCTEGFDNIDKDNFDVTLTPEIEEMSIVYGTQSIRRDNVLSGDVSYDTEYTDIAQLNWYYTYVAVETWFAGAGVTAGDIYMANPAGITAYKTLTSSEVASAQALATAMAELLGGEAYDRDGSYTVRITSPFKYTEVFVSKIIEPTASVNAIPKYTGFKTGAYHPFCLFYYDAALRRSDAQVVPDLTVYVPALNEYSPPLDDTNYKWNVSWEVNHTPMENMKYWRWGYAGSSVYFVQYIITSIEDGSADVNNTLKIDIAPRQTIRTTTETGWNQFPDSLIPEYQFVEGDRIRFITEGTDPSVSGTKMGAVIDGMYDFEIIKYDDTTYEGKYFIYVRNFNYSGGNIGENSLAEIYTPPSDTQTRFYYEFGKLLPIIKDSEGEMVHGGETQNQVTGLSEQPATGKFTFGDVYHILRTPSKPLCSFSEPQRLNGAFHESMAYSDFYSSSVWNKGKIGIEGTIGEVVNNVVRFSNVYLQNTAINGITTFDAGDFKPLNDIYGDIRAIIEVGDTLKCYQDKKASAILIGRTEYVDSEGQTTTPEISTRVLGSVRYQKGNIGTTFPESVVKNPEGYVYGYDAYSGLVWRDTVNGIFPISGRYAQVGGSVDYKMNTYFKNKSRSILASGVENVSVMGVWDEEHKMYILSFKDIVNEANNDTVMFHEPTNRWVTFADFTYTPADGYNQILELTYTVVKGFENGIGFYFNEDTRFAEFDITSSSNATAFADQSTLTGTDLDPTVVCDATPAGSLDYDAFLSIDPTVIISYVLIDEIGLDWTYDEYGETNKKASAVTTYPGGTLISFPSWLTITRASGAVMAVGASISTSETLYFYPSTENDGAARTGSVRINNTVYGDYDTMTVEQGVAPAPTLVTVTTAGDNPSDITFSSMSGIASPGDVGVGSVDIYFTPNHEDYTVGQTIQVFWTSEIDGVRSESPTLISATDEQVNVATIYPTEPIYSGSTITIFLKGVASTDITATTVLDTLTITSLDPIIYSSLVSSSESGFNFLATEGGIGDAQTSVITAPPSYTYLTSKPSWLIIRNPSSDILNAGDTIDDGDTITVYPLSTWDQLYERSGFIVLTTPYGDTLSLPVEQAAASPVGTAITCEISVSSADASGFEFTGSAFAQSGSAEVSISGMAYKPTLGDGEIFTVYFRADIERSGVQTYNRSGSFEVYNNQSGGTVFSLTEDLIAGDVVILQVASVYI